MIVQLDILIDLDQKMNPSATNHRESRLLLLHLFAIRQLNRLQHQASLVD